MRLFKICTILVSMLFLAACGKYGYHGKHMSPMFVEGAKTIGTHELKHMIDDGVTIIDVRLRDEYLDGHIPKSINIDIKNFTEKELMRHVMKDKPLVIHCDSPSGMASSRAARAVEMAVKWGYKDVHYYRDGFVTWERYGLPVDMVKRR